MNTISNIRLHDMQVERRRRAVGIIGAILLTMALWCAIIAAVVALL